MKESRKNFLLVVTSVLSVVLTLEIALRVYYGNPPAFLYPQVSHIHTKYKYKSTPNQKSFTLDQPVVTNSYGFRDYEWEMPKSPGRIRILVVGDSYTFGNAVPFEAIYSKVLERMLKERSPQIEVISTAAMGWATYNEVDFLKTEGLGYQPDVVVIGFYPNDFCSRPLNYEEILSEDGRLESRPRWLQWLPYRYIFFLKRSALLTYLRDRIIIPFQADEDAVNQSIFDEIDLNKDQRVIDTLGYISEMKQACKEKKVKLLLASIPSINLFWVPKGQPGYNERIRSFCRSHDIRFVDLSQGFWKKKNPTDLYNYPWDFHLNPKGHRLVAEQLFQPLMHMLQEVPN